MSRTTGSSGGPTPLREVRYAVLLALLSGCASNSVTTLLKASGQTDALLPNAAVVQSELRGRAFEVGTVAFDVRKAGDKQGPDVPDSAYLELLDGQLRKAFRGAELGRGDLPAHPVDVAIERLKLKPATPLIAEMSVLRVRMEIPGTSGEVLMRGEFQSYLPAPTVLIFAPGLVVPISIPCSGHEYVALAKMFPAVAAVIATTAQGLQQGKTLDAIKVYPEDIEAGNIISPDLFLKHAPFGLTRIDSKEIDRVIKEAKARCDP
jgi:hypothetical protein